MASKGASAASGAASGAAAGTAILPGWGTAIGAVVGGIAGFFSGGDQEEQAQELMKQAQQEIENVGAPPDLSREIILNKFEAAGMLTPQLEQQINQQVSQAANLLESPEGRNNQMAALQLIQQRANGGFTAQDRAALNQNRLAVQRDQEAKRQQIIQNMQARGQGGSGAELQAALLASQAGADQESTSGDQIAAAASQNALQAAGQAGSLSGQVRGQDYQTQLNKAQAADELNRFNVQGAQQRQAANVAAQNNANQYNMTNAQANANMNTQAANSELYRQNQAKQDFWNNSLNYAAAKANAASGQASNLIQQSNNNSQQLQGVLGGVGQAASAYGNQTNQQALLDRLYPKPGKTMAQSNADFYNDSSIPNF